MLNNNFAANCFKSLGGSAGVSSITSKTMKVFKLETFLPGRSRGIQNGKVLSASLSRFRQSKLRLTLETISR
jgi:hypothetical protein